MEARAQRGDIAGGWVELPTFLLWAYIIVQ